MYKGGKISGNNAIGDVFQKNDVAVVTIGGTSYGYMYEGNNGAVSETPGAPSGENHSRIQSKTFSGTAYSYMSNKGPGSPTYTNSQNGSPYNSPKTQI
eukprot:UN24489